MPKLNARGMACCGVGDGTVSVDRRPLIYRAGAACWLDDETVLSNALEPGNIWAVVRCRVADAEIDAVEDPPDGANDLVAGGGRWLGWNPRRGMFGSLGDWSAAGVLAAGRDGTLAYTRDRQVGRGFVLAAPDGREMDVAGAVVYDMQVLGPTAALWYDGAGVRTVGRQPLRFAVQPGRTRLVALDDGDWLVYWSDGVGLVAQLDGAPDGYVLETRPIAFNHDTVAVDGQIVVAWSTTPGEGVNDLEVRLLDRRKPRVPLVAPFTFQPFNHPVLIAPFKDPLGESGAPAEVVVNQTGQRKARPYFMAEDSIEGLFYGRLLGIYSEVPDPVQALQLAERWNTRLLLAHDSTAPWTIPLHMLRPWDIPCVELYRSTNETFGQSLDRWHRSVRTLLQDWSGDCGLIPQFYCGGGAPPNELWTVAQVFEGLAYLSALVNLSPRIKVVAPFAWQRANGITGHPELRAAFEALLRATPGLPTFTAVGRLPPPSPPPKEPTVPAKTNDEVRRDIAELVRFYNDADGLNRASRGIPPPITVDDPAFWDWVALAVTTPIDQVKARIRTFPEWVEQHQGQEPP